MKTLKRIIWISILPGLILLLTFSSASAGPKRKVHVIQLPRVAADGSVPKSAGVNEFIFLDEESSSLLLAFPPDLTDENKGENMGKKSASSRIPLSIGVQPTVQTRIISPENSLLYKYEFEVGNEPQAKTSIAKWILSLSSLEQVTSQDGPGGWNWDKWELRKGREANRLHVMNMIPGTPPIAEDQIVYRIASWWYLREDVVVTPKSSKIFTVESSYLPGLVEAYFQGAPYMPAGHIGPSVPGPVRELIPAFNFVETNSVSIPVIGPRIDPSLLKEARICMLLSDLAEFVEKGLIEESPFIKQALTLSKSCLSKDINELTEAVNALKARAGDDFEDEIFDALVTNLRVN